MNETTYKAIRDEFHSMKQEAESLLAKAKADGNQNLANYAQGRIDTLASVNGILFLNRS